MPRGAAKAGGRPPKPEGSHRTPWNTRVEPQELATLREFPQSQAASLLAQGLRLGRGNLPEFTDAERVLLAEVLHGADPLTLRHLEDELEDLETDDGSPLPERDSLVAKLRPLGDWERLALRLGAQQALHPNDQTKQ